MKNTLINKIDSFLELHLTKIILVILTAVSIYSFVYFYQNKLGLTYNDARSHLDIGRRVVEGLKPGLAQLGSVWLPLPHFLMVFTVWNDFMWHSGLAGAIISMIAYVASAIYINLILKLLNVKAIFRLFGILIFATNANILYLQSTAMTELLLILTLTAGVYEVINWSLTKNHYSLIKGAFWIMLSTLVRYEGWFLFLVASGLIAFLTFREKGKKAAEGMLILFTTLSGFGIVLWFMWNKIIFGDFFFFIFGPFSAHAQQEQLQAAGDLLTKGNLSFSVKIYTMALYYCMGIVTLLATILGVVLFIFDRKFRPKIRMVIITLLLSPLVFNILALYLGHSVVFIEGLSGKSWFNIRYGVMIMPAAAVFGAYLLSKAKFTKIALATIFVATAILSIVNINKSVTIADALYGSSGKDTSQIAGWLQENIKDQNTRVLISTASHDAIIFSSGLSMNQIIHEGTGPFWDSATKNPDHWAKYIVMRTYDTNDSTWRLLKDRTFALEMYDIAYKGRFADIYRLKDEYNYLIINDYSLSAFDNYQDKKYQKEQIVAGSHILNDYSISKQNSPGKTIANIFVALLIIIFIPAGWGIYKLKQQFT